MLKFDGKPMGFEVIDPTDYSETVRYDNDLTAVVLNPSFNVQTGFGNAFLQIRHFPLNRKHTLIHFSYTGRSQAFLQGDNSEGRVYFPERFFSKAMLKGKVLDIDCGWGAFVADLNTRGVDAYGIDLYLPSALRKKPFLVQSLFEESHLAEYQFHTIFSTWGSFYFERAGNKTLARLRHARDLLRVGGNLLLNPVRLDTIDELVKKVGGMELQPVDKGWYPHKPEWRYAQIIRTR